MGLEIRVAICHHLSLSYFGGGEKWVISTAKELMKRGHEVEIFCLPFSLEKERRKTNVLSDLLEDISYTESHRHKVKADVVYVTYNPLSWLCFQTSTPRIAGLHSHSYWLNPHPHYGLLPNIANIVNRFTSYFELRRFAAVHTVTDVYPINHPRVYYIPNFVDSEKYLPCADKPNSFTVAFASRTVWQKGWDIYNHVKQKAEDVVFKESLGKVPEKEMPQFLSSAHVTLAPSRVDTFGLSIVESLMSGTPVITSPLKTHVALHLPVVYAYSVGSCLNAITMFQKIWEDETDVYKRICKLIRQKALKFDKKVIIDQLENMFKDVVD